MIFLINCSNLKVSGGLQVAKSICEQLNQYKNHHFIVVLSTFINDEHISTSENVEVFKYNIPQNVKSVLFGRDAFLDGLVEEKHVDAVLTVFGPSLWRPRVPHLCGFARAQLLKEVNPDYHPTFKERLIYKIWAWGFRKSSKVFYTENPYISDLLPGLIKGCKVYTVTNYYNQIYDTPGLWKRTKELPVFDGITCLSISGHMAHKNFEILPGVVDYLEENYPTFRFRFVLTFDESEMHIPEHQREHYLFIGKVDIDECLYLYEQSDIMFMPTLMECFTATYPEAMRMGKPIVTTDLEFARGLCGNSACFYSPVDAKSAAEAIYKVASDKVYRNQLIANGEKQLLFFDDYRKRTEKLINILEEIA